MKLRNRKGSTLAMTIMIFAILMIFVTFILNFMVTENKQAIYHEKKSQTYFVARSGAEAVESAILKIYNADDNTDEIDFFNSLGATTVLDTINVEGKDVTVSLKLEQKPDDSDNFILDIISSSEIDGVKNQVVKTLNIPRPIKKSEIVTNAPITYLNNINEKIDKINDFKAAENKDPLAVKGDPDDYPLYTFIPETFPLVYPDPNPFDILPTSGSISGNYYVENLNGNSLKNLTFSGETNIYVKNKYIIDANNDLHINSSGESENLNIYAYSGIEYNGDSGKTIYQHANLFIPFGVVNLDAHKLEHKGNIVLGQGVNMNILVNDNGSDGHANIEGMIYGPESVINIGDDNHGALSVKGSIVGYDVNYLYKNVNNSNNLKLTVDNSGGVKNPIEFEEYVLTTVQKGYFK